jgi:hypothetical protein
MQTAEQWLKEGEQAEKVTRLSTSINMSEKLASRKANKEVCWSPISSRSSKSPITNVPVNSEAQERERL